MTASVCIFISMSHACPLSHTDCSLQWLIWRETVWDAHAFLILFWGEILYSNARRFSFWVVADTQCTSYTWRMCFDVLKASRISLERSNIVNFYLRYIICYRIYMFAHAVLRYLLGIGCDSPSTLSSKPFVKNVRYL